MNASPALATRTSSFVPPLSADEEVGLAALLKLFTSEDSEAADGRAAVDGREAVVTATRRSIRSQGARLRMWAAEWVRRASAWGSGPEGAWRAW